MHQRQGGTAACLSSEQSILNYFGTGLTADVGLQNTHTRSVGDFVKVAAIPEPGTLLLLGIGLAGLGFGASRRKQVAA